MDVKKIFFMLITIVACVLIGAFFLNLILPNALTQLVNASEDMLYNATGMSFDFNGDGDAGGANANREFTGGEGDTSETGKADVEGFN